MIKQYSRSGFIDILLFCLLPALAFAGITAGCSCDKEKPQPDPVTNTANVTHIRNQHGKWHDEEDIPPPQPAPFVTGGGSSRLPSNCPVILTILGAEKRMFYSQFSATLIKGIYHFQLEAKTRGRVGKEKETLQVPPYLRLGWKIDAGEIESLLQLEGKTFIASGVFLPEAGAWASGSEIALQFSGIGKTNAEGTFEGSFRFVSGPLKGRKVRVTGGRFKAFISNSFPVGLKSRVKKGS